MPANPLSNLTVYSAYHLADELLILDMVDTTMAPSGTAMPNL
jgi:hypothetical protein